MEEMKLSCVDCGNINCNAMDKKYPDFCLTTNMNECAIWHRKSFQFSSTNLCLPSAVWQRGLQALGLQRWVWPGAYSQGVHTQRGETGVNIGQ